MVAKETSNSMKTTKLHSPAHGLHKGQIFKPEGHGRSVITRVTKDVIWYAPAPSRLQQVIRAIQAYSDSKFNAVSAIFRGRG